MVITTFIMKHLYKILLFLSLVCVASAQTSGFKNIAVSGTGTVAVFSSSNATITGGSVSASTLTGTAPSISILNTGDITLSGSATSDSGGGDIHFPSSDQPRYGIWWGGEANMTGIAADRHDSGQDKLRITSRLNIDLLPAQAFQGGFIQMGNNSGSGEYIFISSEGTATASNTTTASHDLYFNTTYWTSSAQSDRVLLRANTDTSGNSRLSFYGTPSSTAPSFNAGLGIYQVAASTEHVSLAEMGVAVISGSAAGPSYRFLSGTNSGLYYTGSGVGISVTGTNVGTWSAAGLTNVGEFFAPANNANPAYAFTGALTSGLGCFGSDWQLVRVGVVQLYGDGSGVTVVPNLFPAGVVRGADGTVGAPEYAFSADTNTGIYRIGTDNLGIVTGGTNQIVVANTGVSVTGTANIAGAITTAADMTWSDVSEGPVIKSPDGNRWRIAVDNAGALSATDLDP